MKSKMLVISIFVSCILNVVFLYMIFDQSISLDHCRQANKYQEETIQLLKSLSNDLKPLSEKKEIIDKINTSYISDHIVKEDEKGVLFINNIGIKFFDEKFDKYIFLNE